MNTLTKINNLRAKITKAESEIKSLQIECPHNTERVTHGRNTTYPEYVTRTHQSDTGNWCKNDDVYWTECHCTLCDAKWREDGSI